MINSNRYHTHAYTWRTCTHTHTQEMWWLYGTPLYAWQSNRGWKEKILPCARIGVKFNLIHWFNSDIGHLLMKGLRWLDWVEKSSAPWYRIPFFARTRTQGKGFFLMIFSSRCHLDQRNYIPDFLKRKIKDQTNCHWTQIHGRIPSLVVKNNALLSKHKTNLFLLLYLLPSFIKKNIALLSKHKNNIFLLFLFLSFFYFSISVLCHVIPRLENKGTCLPSLLWWTS